MHMMVRTYKWSIAISKVVKIWTIGVSERRRLDTVEMWSYIRVKKIKWVNKIINEQVLDIIREKNIAEESERR